MKRIFFKSMPQKWQDEFTSNGNNDISVVTMSALMKFMKQQEATSRTKNAMNKAKQAAAMYKRPYPVAHAHFELFKTEIERLVSIGVLKKVGASEWGLPSFPIPKKDNRIRFISDLRELNKVIKRKVYPLRKIADVHNGSR